MRIKGFGLDAWTGLLLVVGFALLAQDGYSKARTSNVWEVPQMYATIQEAINVASYGDTVTVSAGTYYERITLEQGVTVIAAGTDEERSDFITAERTIIDVSGAGGGPLIAVQGADEAILDGFTITGATGGGIGVLTTEPITLVASSPTIRNCIIRNNSIGVAGAYEASPTLHHNIVRDNEVGIGNRGIGTSPTMSSNDIYSNSQVGIGCDGSSPEIFDNYLGDNGGPGIGARNGATPFVHDNLIGVDRAGVPRGNALAGVGCDGSSPIIQGNSIYYNERAGVGARNGATPTVIDNMIGFNAEAGVGSLIDNPAEHLEVHRNWIHDNGQAGIGGYGATAFVTNNITEANGAAGIAATDTPFTGIYNNVSVYNAQAGITNQSGTAFPIENNICAYNLSAGIKDDSQGYDYNLLYDNNNTNGETGSDPWTVYPNYAGSWAGEHGVVPIADPLFVDPGNGDYHLQPSSPAIDAGNPDPAFEDTDGSTNDIGAYGGPNPFTQF